MKQDNNGNYMLKNKKPLSPYCIILKYNGLSSTYRIPKDLFLEIQNKITGYRVYPSQVPPIRCIETGMIFYTIASIKVWLCKNNITKISTADKQIKKVCNGELESAFGYHWEFIK